MIDDANRELEQIAPENRHVSDVLAARVQIYRALKTWDLLQAVAKQLARREPDNPQWQEDWAYATRRVESIEVEGLILIAAAERHPEVAIFHYNLAC